MERNEMIKVLMEKAKISHEEAEETLKKNDWDLLDSIIYLERKGKIENNQTTTIVEVGQTSKEENKKESDKNKCGGVGTVIGRIFKFIGKVIKKGNNHHFEISKENEKPIRITLTISVLLFIIAFWAVSILLIVGLFCGYKYSITGSNINTDKVNDILGKASKSADNIKDDFKKGYND
ncbi:DUF4342 domain-containing protein [Clostridium sp. SHJSY1]|uniref:DUF4342 domain-containing protein n=1 Tax=Clostridium sp. SHJSY1 TaxID=2942483 RepID=UPI002874CD37|nr:DUF4342 domain-containing protein [Clostridium sp. SHJSY1]MDS0524720.1 DUF4342 domain-containing protein [Clostridium sp. SHJSY1]